MKICKFLSLILLTALTANAFGMNNNNNSTKELRAFFQKKHPNVIPGILQKINVNSLTLTGHTNTIISVALSEDASLAFTADDGNSVKAWNSTTGECMRTRTGYIDNFSEEAFSADDSIAVTISDNGCSANVLDLTTYQYIGTLTGHTDMVSSVDLSRDGFIALTGSRDKTAKVWNLRTLLSIKRFLENNLTFEQAQLLIPIHAAIQANAKHVLTQEEQQVFNQLPDTDQLPIKGILRSYVAESHNNNNNNAS